MSETNDNIVTLTDENGVNVPFEFLDLIEYERDEYVVLLPCDDDSGEVVILRLEETSGSAETYASVEDQETLDAVFDIFKEKYKEEFNFAEE